MTREATRILNLALGLALVAMTAASLSVGPAPYTAASLPGLLVGDGDPRARMILIDLRLPRTVLAILIGGGLGVAGAALQGLLRNPLAEPGLVGVSAAAGFGAVVAIYYGLAAVTLWAVPVAALVLALISAVVLLLIARGDDRPLTVILAGVALSSLFIALTSAALSLAPTPFALSEMVSWLLGSLQDRGARDVWLTMPFILLGIVILLSARRDLDALALGEEAAQSMGVNVRAVQRRVVVGAALAVSAGVAAAGSIGFIGLVVPHLLRPLVGAAPGRLLFPSFLGGAALLLAADIGARSIRTDQELQLGVLTGLFGAPFFLWLVLRLRRVAS